MALGHTEYLPCLQFAVEDTDGLFPCRRPLRRRLQRLEGRGVRHAPERVADRPRLVAGYATQAATAAEAADDGSWVLGWPENVGCSGALLSANSTLIALFRPS